MEIEKKEKAKVQKLLFIMEILAQGIHFQRHVRYVSHISLPFTSDLNSAVLTPSTVI